MQGLLLHAIIQSAGVQDRDGGIWLLATLFGQFPFLAKLFADSAYAGPIFDTALNKVLPNLKTEIVRRSDRAKWFVPLPKRWIVERTIAWLNRCRRLAKDWENLNRSARAFLKLASMRLMDILCHGTYLPKGRVIYVPKGFQQGPLRMFRHVSSDRRTFGLRKLSMRPSGGPLAYPGSSHSASFGSADGRLGRRPLSLMFRRRRARCLGYCLAFWIRSKSRPI